MILDNALFLNNKLIYNALCLKITPVFFEFNFRSVNHKSRKLGFILKGIIGKILSLSLKSFPQLHETPSDIDL